MENKNILIGYHIPKLDKFNARNILSKEITAFQMFVSNPINWSKAYSFNDSEEKSLIKLKEYGIKGVIHGKYLYNFCRKGNKDHIPLVLSELNVANKIGCDLILHQGKNVADEHISLEEALNNFCFSINSIIEQSIDLNNSVILENSAHQGTELGFSLEELGVIYNKIKCLNQNSIDRIGFCLDTCHSFVAGQCTFKTQDDVSNYLNDFDKFIGLNKLKYIHFNDSSIKFNGRNDHHCDIFCGHITNPLFGGSIDGLQYLANYAHEHSIPLIMETPFEFNIHNFINITIDIIKELCTNKTNKTSVKYNDLINSYPSLLQNGYDLYINNKKK